jgi:iron complex outermembrane receptor protein
LGFNTRKHTLSFSTGLIDDHFELAGRVSVFLKSDGYIDRATDLKSYFKGTYVGKTTLIKALALEEQKNLSVLEWIRRFDLLK